MGSKEIVKQIDGSSAASVQRGTEEWDSELRASLCCVKLGSWG